MRAASALTSVVVLASLALAGCVGTGAGGDAVASPSSEEATDPDGNATDAQASGNGTDTEASSNATDAQPSMNLTVEVADANATWRVAPMDYLPWNVTVIEVFVDVNGTVTEGGDPVDGEDVGGETAVTGPRAWGCATCFNEEVVTRRASYEATTGADGNFSASAGPVYFATKTEPPLLYPYCEWTKIEASGTLADGDETGPSDDDSVGMTVCTQTYP